MAELIAVAGKGGVGKSTFSALTIRYLLKNFRPILAVDADPNSNLPVMLGLTPSETIGTVMEDFMSSKLKIPSGMSKQSWLLLRLSQAVAEGKGLDLIVMGRPEGTGCYCSANTVLRDFLDRMRENYQWVVVDNEAGMEHLSRRTEGKIDYLFIVSDPTVKGLRTVNHLMTLVSELKLELKEKFLIVNRASELEPKLKEWAGKSGAKFLGTIPEDMVINDYDLEEKPLLSLPDSSSAVQAIEKLLEKAFENMAQKKKLAIG